MRNRIIIIIYLLGGIFTNLMAQKLPDKWDLAACINYALENNIQVQRSSLALEQSIINSKQAKAQMLPSLSASIGQNFTNRPFIKEGGQYAVNSYNGNYGLNASMTLFNGGKLIKTAQQQKLQEESSKYGVLEAEKSIEMSILQIYMQILYAREAVDVYKDMIEVSEYQLERGNALLVAGSISRVDLAQLEAQLSSDKFQLITAQNTLDYAVLQLKQLLELQVNETVDIITPELNGESILKPLPVLNDVYNTALDVMPQIRGSKVDMDIAALGTSIARAGYYPRVSLTASVGTTNMSGAGLTFSEQLRDNFSDGVGVTVSVPIYSNRDNKSAVEKARINEKTTQLDYIQTEKDLQREVELAYQDAVSAQNQYLAASENVKALETSYDLILQQYNLGMKNTLELLTERNNLLSARQSLLQSKYTSVMNSQILNLYQNLPLEIK